MVLGSGLSVEDSDDLKLREAERREIRDCKALVVRHGNSRWIPSTKGMSMDFTLSGIGHKQSRLLADFMPHEPKVIILSPYIRTGLTAVPMMEKFPEAEVWVWPTQEFAYLDLEKYARSTPEEREACIEAFFDRTDPEYCDGPGAESFRDFWMRVEKVRKRIREVVPGTMMFTHGLFMRMMKMQDMGWFDSPTSEAMRQFTELGGTMPIANTARMAVNAALEFDEPRVSHLPRELITY